MKRVDKDFRFAFKITQMHKEEYLRLFSFDLLYLTGCLMFSVGKGGNCVVLFDVQ